MELIGHYDSPYVRRVAISLHRMGLTFRHNPLSVFADYDALAAINPAVKVPTLVTDEGVVLIDSTLILEYAEHLVPADQHLMPTDADQYLRAQRIIGLALAANEKSVALVYEHLLRPPEKRHQPWIDRVTDQLAGAYRALEQEAAIAPQLWLCGDQMLEPDITAAVSFRFTREMLAERFSLRDFPHMAALSARAEETDAFRACPYIAG